MDNYIIATDEAIREAENHHSLKKIDKINTPFGYFGSKNKIALQLCTQLPPHTCWVEAFCGSAALTLAKKMAPIEVINDIDNDIVNVFKQLRYNHVELCRLISLTPYAKSELEQSRTIDGNDHDLEKARKFLVQAMMAINGAFGKDKGGFSYSQSYSREGKDARVNRWYNLPDRLFDVIERLRNVRIDNRDAIELLTMFIKRPATLVYLDPPYLTDRSMGYTIEANDEEFHIRLLETANKARCMIFVSGYENELYNSILSRKKGWKKRKIDTIVKDVKGNDFERNEVIWMNKHFQKASLMNRLPLRLTKHELKGNKLNPERK